MRTAIRLRSSSAPLALVLASAQIALPLSGDLVAGMTIWVVWLLSCLTFTLALPKLGFSKALMALGGISLVGFGVEALGVHSAFPFGNYAYTNRLQPQVGGVPLIIGLAWFSMALPAWSTAGALAMRPAARVITGALLLGGWDLFLDPQMVDSGMWRWSQPGPAWEGIPLVNFAGWIGVSIGIMALLHIVTSRLKVPDPAGPELTALYAWMVAMSTLGFVLPFAFDRPAVGIVGGLSMLPAAVLGLRNSLRRTP